MISVIVPVFNTSAYLENVIRLLRGQCGNVEAELIFVDNGSEDASREILGRHCDLRVIEEPERGSYAARNAGIRVARGEIIAFTELDDGMSGQLGRLIRPTEIADAICFMIANSAVTGELWADAGWHPTPA